MILFSWIFFNSGDKNDASSELVKVSLRDVGHQLLLSNQDSTSLVLPVIELEASKYKLSFSNNILFEPGDLVAITQKSFQKGLLPDYYLVEVVQCEDGEVAYSYEMKYEEEKSIIPCSGRVLPLGCYTIEVQFINRRLSFSNQNIFLYLIISIAFVFLLDFFILNKKQKNTEEFNGEFASIGSFKFYPDQNKLVKQAIEISLSKKECELLEIFIANPNQIIKRDELTKRVWEDNGVIVGRSLDTYISKLRKKLKDDESIKLTNVHGVGYKLEVNN